MPLNLRSIFGFIVASEFPKNRQSEQVVQTLHFGVWARRDSDIQFD